MGAATHDLASRGHLVPGYEAPVFEHLLTLGDLVRYSGASGDDFPIHHDDDAARQHGLPGVIGHGMFSAGLLSRAVMDAVGVEHLRRYTVHFVGMTLLGQTLRTDVRVERRDDNADGSATVVLAGRLVDEHGRVKVTAEVLAELPAHHAA